MFSIISFIMYFLIFGDSSSRVDEYLKTELPEYSRIEYKVAALPFGIESLNDERLLFDNGRKPKLAGSYLYIPVDIVTKGKKSSMSTITLKVKVYRYAYIAIKQIKTGELINPLDFEYAECEVSSVKSEIDIRFNDKTFYRAKFNIAPQTILETNIIEESPVIKIGKEINATKVSGNVLISFTVKARQDGAVGDNIKVMREDNKVFKAEIIDSVNVKIIE
ncbi:MAG: flagellar basal body P-ring formation chaperone FlgA [bacterium]